MFKGVVQFVNDELSHHCKSMFTYNHELYETKPRSHGILHLYPTRMFLLVLKVSYVSITRNGYGNLII